jgi:hypothetical protein
MECGDLSPLSTGRLVGPHNNHAKMRGGVTSPAVKSGDKSPHSIMRHPPPHYTFIGGRVPSSGVTARSFIGT